MRTNRSFRVPCAAAFLWTSLVVLSVANCFALHSDAAEVALSHPGWAVLQTIALATVLVPVIVAMGRVGLVGVIPVYGWLIFSLGIELFLTTHFRGDLDTWGGEWLMVLMNSSPQEIREFLSECLSPVDVMVAIGLTVWFVIVVFAGWKLERGLRNRGVFAAFCIGVFAVMMMPFSRVPSCDFLVPAVSGHTYMESPFSMSCFRELSAAGSPVEKGSYQVSGGKAPLVVIIAGESVSRAHMSLFGYSVPTTPNMDALRDELVIGSVHSDAWLTTEALLSWFTDHDASNGVKGTVSLPAMMRSAGFPTALISNQNHWGHVDGADVLVFRACERKVYLADGREGVRYDEELLPELDRVLAEMPKGGLVIVHPLGSHRVFSERVPKGFAADLPRTDASVGDSQESRRVFDYDRSITYSDRVSAEIVKRVRDLGGESVVIYFSDHGEIPAEEIRRDCPEVRAVPFWMWFSPEYRNEHTDLVTDMSCAANLPRNSDAFFPLFMRIIGLEKR